MSGPHPVRHRPWLVLVALALVVALIGACTVTSRRQPQRDAVAQVLAGGTLEIDLSSPPSREDLALPEGMTSTVLAVDDGPVDVVVTFRDGTVLRTPAEDVFVRAPDGTSAPHGVDVLRRGLTQQELRAAGNAAVADLGVDAAEVARTLAEAARPLDFDYRRVLDTRVQAPDHLQVEVGTTALEGRGSVNYLVSW